MRRRTSIPRRIGRALRTRRKTLKFTQKDFARTLRMDRAYYSSIERGLKRIRIKTLERLCLGLDIRPWEILRDAEEQPR